MEHLIEDTLDALEESQRLFAEIELEDKSAYVPVCTLALATLTKLTGDIRDAGEWTTSSTPWANASHSTT